MKSSNINYFQTNITIKLRFPNLMTRNYWAIEELSEKKLHAVPFIAALMIVTCAKPISKSNLFEFIATKLNAQIEQLEKTLQNLIVRKIIIPSEQLSDYQSFFETFLKLTKAGWDDAANYHFFTWDAPFLDYTKEGEGHEIDRKKMVGYQSLQPDLERYKKYEVSLEKIPLPSFDNIPTEHKSQNYTISEKVKLLMSFTFGKKGEKPCHWNDVPLIRRTSPSGGSRHPTEGYFLSANLEDIQNGFYHIQTDPVSLCLISPEKHCLIDEFIDEKDFNEPLLGSIILTSVFERNMYRYREPRTFRTIHMDIGHIIATIEMLGKELNIRTCIHLNFDENAILQKIGASVLDEGVMAIITLLEEKC